MPQEPTALPFVRLQPDTPGSPQNGHVSVSGTIIGGQFVGGGAGLTNVNADLLDGLDSTAFLQSIPVPLTLSGSSDTHIIRGENSHVNGKAIAGYSTATGANFPQPMGVYGESAADNGRGVVGSAPGVAGFGVIGSGGQAGVLGSGFTGVWGDTIADGGRAVYGSAGGPGNSYGGYFEATGPDGTGVFGYTSASLGVVNGVHGVSDSVEGRGVFGLATAATGGTYGVWGQSTSVDGRGVYGQAAASTGETYGVWGQSTSVNGRGVYGQALATSGITYGGYFVSSSQFGTGVYGGSSGYIGVHGNGYDGVRGEANGTNGYGVSGSASGTSGIGVYGSAHAANGATFGGFFLTRSTGTNSSGVLGIAAASTGTTYGVWGHNESSTGYGVIGTADRNVGTATYGVYGRSNSTAGRGVYGLATAANGNTTYAVLGDNALNGSGWGVYALGNLGGSGAKLFRIDHPLDPENKYLLHYSTEMPEPQNAYNGVIVTDARGEAWVQLPDYFGAINRDFRYQLTVVDDTDSDLFVMAKVARKIRDNRFKIRTNAPNVEVAWEVKAIRNDRWVQKYGAPVEIEKQGREKGTYQHPDLYDMPEERGMSYRPKDMAVAPPNAPRRK